jgi:hypothetical protein
MAELMPQDAPAWSQFIRDFDGAARSFASNRAALAHLAPYIQGKHPELLSQYQALVSRSNTLAPKLQALADTRARVAGWLGAIGNVYQTAVDATSLAIERAAGFITSARRSLGLGQLGIAPVIVVIGVVAAGATLALITKWVADTYMFAKRVNAMQELEAKGYSAEAAANAVNQVIGKPGAPGGIERTLSSILWVVAISVIAMPLISRMLQPSNSRK